MCWCGKEEHLKIAENDITVVKVLYKTPKTYDDNFMLLSPYRDMKYEVGEEYKQKILPSGYCIKGLLIEYGLHCYSKHCKKRIFNGQGEIKLKIYSKKTADPLDTFFASSDKKRSIILAEFIIPSGTRFYENEAGEIVTEKYKFLRYEDVQ